METGPICPPASFPSSISPSTPLEIIFWAIVFVVAKHKVFIPEDLSFWI